MKEGEQDPKGAATKADTSVNSNILEELRNYTISYGVQGQEDRFYGAQIARKVVLSRNVCFQPFNTQRKLFHMITTSEIKDDCFPCNSQYDTSQTAKP